MSKRGLQAAERVLLLIAAFGGIVVGQFVVLDRFLREPGWLIGVFLTIIEAAYIISKIWKLK